MRNMKKRAKSKTVVYELKADQPLTTRQKREIQALAAMPEDKIDTSDIPELPPEAWKNAVRGKWYRPVKQAVSIRLDADVLAWLRAKGDGYQSERPSPETDAEGNQQVGGRHLEIGETTQRLTHSPPRTNTHSVDRRNCCQARSIKGQALRLTAEAASCRRVGTLS